jgi:hypothetical protein
MSNILCVPNHRENPDRQNDYFDFQLGFQHGCQSGINFPGQLNRFAPLKRPVDPYVYGFHQGRRYIKRSMTTTTPMNYDKSVWNGFRRWERNYQEGNR